MPDGKIVVLSTHDTIKEARIERMRLVIKYVDEWGFCYAFTEPFGIITSVG